MPARPVAPDLAVLAPPDAHCPSAAALKASVDRRAGRAVFVSPNAPETQVLVVFAPRPGAGWTVTLEARSVRGDLIGKRTLETASARCSELDEAIVVVVSTLVGVSTLDAAAPPPEPEPAPEPEPVAQPDPPPTLAPAAKPSPDRRAFTTNPRPSVLRTARTTEPFRVRGLLGLELDSGFLPAYAAGLSAGALAQTSTISLGISMLVMPRDRTELGAAEARFRAALATLQACANTLPGGTLRVDVCVGARLGALFVRTRGLVTNADAHAFFAALELALRLAWVRPHGALHPYGLLGASLPVRSLRFYYESAESVRDDYHTTLPGVFVGLGSFFGGSS